MGQETDLQQLCGLADCIEMPSSWIIGKAFCTPRTRFTLVWTTPQYLREMQGDQLCALNPKRAPWQREVETGVLGADWL